MIGRWRSSHLENKTAVALSSAEAEYTALSATAKELTWAVRLMKELGEPELLKKPVKVWCDSQAAVELIRSYLVKGRSKHIDVRMHDVRDLVKDRLLIVNHVPGAENPADVLTKGLPRRKTSAVEEAWSDGFQEFRVRKTNDCTSRRTQSLSVKTSR